MSQTVKDSVLTPEMPYLWGDCLSGKRGNVTELAAAMEMPGNWPNVWEVSQENDIRKTAYC